MPRGFAFQIRASRPAEMGDTGWYYRKAEQIKSYTRKRIKPKFMHCRTCGCRLFAGRNIGYCRLHAPDTPIHQAIAEWEAVYATLPA